MAAGEAELSRRKSTRFIRASMRRANAFSVDPQVDRRSCPSLPSLRPPPHGPSTRRASTPARCRRIAASAFRSTGGSSSSLSASAMRAPRASDHLSPSSSAALREAETGRSPAPKKTRRPLPNLPSTTSTWAARPIDRVVAVPPRQLHEARLGQPWSMPGTSTAVTPGSRANPGRTRPHPLSGCRPSPQSSSAPRATAQAGSSAAGSAKRWSRRTCRNCEPPDGRYAALRWR